MQSFLLVFALVLSALLSSCSAVCDNAIEGWTVTTAFGTPPPDLSAAAIYSYGNGFVVWGAGGIFNFTLPTPDNLKVWNTSGCC